MKAIRTILLVASIGSTAPLSGEQRSFTSNDGKSITAELVSATKEQATLKLENGQETVLPITRFGDADQGYIREWSKAHPVTTHYDFAMTWTKGRDAMNTKTDTNRGTKTTTEKWSCHFKITNRSHQTLDGLEAHWQIYYNKTNGRNTTLEHKDGVKNIPEIKHMDTITVDTAPIQLNTVQMIDGLVYTDGTPAKYFDTFKGISMRLVREGETVFESTTNGITRSAETPSKKAK